MVRFLLAAALVATAPASDPDATGTDEPPAAPPSSIIGGSLSTLEAVVSIIGVATDGSEGAFCSGVLFQPRVVLTAAHCLTDTEAQLVYFGDDLLFDPGEVVAIESVLAHPDWTNELVPPISDLGIVVLAEDAPQEIAPIQLAENPLNQLLGETLTVAGFGVADSGEVDGKKRQATVVVEEVLQDTVVAVPGSGTACFGDSGGPLLDLSDGIHLVAINSFVLTEDCMGDEAGLGAIILDWHSDWLSDNLPNESGGGNGGGGNKPGNEDPPDDDLQTTTLGELRANRAGSGCSASLLTAEVGTRSPMWLLLLLLGSSLSFASQARLRRRAHARPSEAYEADRTG